MKTDINFILPEEAAGYRQVKSRFLLTFNAERYAQADATARLLDTDLITLTRAALYAVIDAVQRNPEVFRAEAARAHARAAEAAELHARELARAAQRLASPEQDTCDGYSPVALDDIPDTNSDL